MKIPVILFSLLLLVLSGCSRHAEPPRGPDPALQKALDELIRMKSATEVGLTYSEYSDRLLTCKGNMDVALQHSSDEPGKAKIKTAMGWYVDARKAWKSDIDNSAEGTTNLPGFWKNAEDATQKASEYILADETTRQLIARHEQEDKAREAALQDANSKVSVEFENQRKAIKEAPDRQLAEARKQQAAEAAERERARRYAPEGTGFNINPIPITTADTVTTIPAAGTAHWRSHSKKPDGSVHVKMGDFETDLPATEITNDRDLAATLRSNEQNKQEAIRQWRLQQAAALQGAKEAGQTAQSTPTPTPAPEDDSSSLGVKPNYVSPLERKSY